MSWEEKTAKPYGYGGLAYRDVIPASTLDGLRLYVEGRIPTGSFLYAVLSNSLIGAMGRADDRNRQALHAIVAFVYNEIPRGCHGSPEAVRAWLAREAS